MAKLYARIKSRQAELKYRVFVDTDQGVFDNKGSIIENAIPYDPSTLLESEMWFYIDTFSKRNFAIDIITEGVNPADYHMLSRSELSSIDFLFEIVNGDLYFQKIGVAKRIQKKGIFGIGNDFKYCEDYFLIPINDYPDAIYDHQNDKLFFRNLSSISSIFPGIGELYREATEKETKVFLDQDFISLGADFNEKKVSVPNRRRIALAMETLSKLKKKEKNAIFQYIADYCPGIKKDDKSFSINSDEDLKNLLWGIEQRFYTTPIGNEKRIANSVIKME